MSTIKKIDAFIDPQHLDSVKTTLHQAGVNGITVAEVHDHRHNAMPRGRYRGVAFPLDFFPQLQLTVVAREEQVGRIIDVIVGTVQPATVDDRITVSPVEDVVRIRTGEHGLTAL